MAVISELNRHRLQDTAIVTTTEGSAMNARFFTHYILPLAFSVVVYALSLGLVALSISLESTFLTILSLIFTASPLYAMVYFMAEYRRERNHTNHTNT